MKSWSGLRTTLSIIAYAAAIVLFVALARFSRSWETNNEDFQLISIVVVQPRVVAAVLIAANLAALLLLIAGAAGLTWRTLRPV